VEVDGEPVPAVAASALAALGLTAGTERAGAAATHVTGGDAVRAGGGRAGSFGSYLWQQRGTLQRQLLRHLWLVVLALGSAVLVAVPLGLVLERLRRLSGPSLGVLRSKPSQHRHSRVHAAAPRRCAALVAPLAVRAYPIARGTFTGVRDADPSAVETAEALGTTPVQRLLLVRLPLAAPVIMAGVRTAAVLAVGAATLAAFIGAGGLGEPIVAGLALADTRMILSGALPAAALALAVDGVLALVERRVAPAHLRGSGR
jgi:osmoprotectant transport system permease protein